MCFQQWQAILYRCVCAQCADKSKKPLFFGITRMLSNVYHAVSPYTICFCKAYISAKYALYSALWTYVDTWILFLLCRSIDSVDHIHVEDNDDFTLCCITNEISF